MIWIVEMWNDAYKRTKPRWEPTVGAALGRTEARRVMGLWRRANPSDKFRLRLYGPVK